MFTGLIKDIGTVIEVTKNSEGQEMVIESTALIHDIKIDDSISTNGVCLTATKVLKNTFTVQAVHATLEKTNVGSLKVGSKLNLELAMRANDRFGGHFVQGHVNDTGKIEHIKKLGDNYEFKISAKEEVFKYIISEGSITLDGISLTIAKREKTSFIVSIIPHTYQKTALHLKKVGGFVNIEVDMMAKYLENFIRYDREQLK